MGMRRNELIKTPGAHTEISRAYRPWTKCVNLNFKSIFSEEKGAIENQPGFEGASVEVPYEIGPSDLEVSSLTLLQVL